MSSCRFVDVRFVVVVVAIADACEIAVGSENSRNDAALGPMTKSKLVSISLNDAALGPMTKSKLVSISLNDAALGPMTIPQCANTITIKA